MSNYTNTNDAGLYWNSPQEIPNQTGSYYDSDFNSLQNQQLDFQTFGQDQTQYYTQPPEGSNVTSILEPNKSQFMYSTGPYDNASDVDEPPLLEELEIYPDRIIEKMMAVLNPFRGHSLADDSDFLMKETDLAGPISFCIILALALFVSGSKVYFGYIYGISVISCLMMYCLLSLMTTTNSFTLSSVTSILGYSLLPIVALAVLGVFMSLHGTFGIVITIIAILWSSLSASRLFIAISGDHDQRPLIAYPCALVCGVFALLVVF